MSPSHPSLPDAEDAEAPAGGGMSDAVLMSEEEAPAPSQLDPASIRSPILDMDPIPGVDQDTLAVLHAVRTTPGDHKEIAKRVGLSIQRTKQILNSLVCRGHINRRRVKP